MSYFIYRCSNYTYNECIRRSLFGQTDKMRYFVKDVKPGDLLFLHNLSEEFIEGPFEALTDGAGILEPSAWNGKFPLQVRVRQLPQCRRISCEDALESGLNYAYENIYFDFKIPDNIGRKLSGIT